MSIELSEQEQLRRQSLAALRELGIDPYPAARYEVTATARVPPLPAIRIYRLQ